MESIGEAGLQAAQHVDFQLGRHNKFVAQTIPHLTTLNHFWMEHDDSSVTIERLKDYLGIILRVLPGLGRIPRVVAH
jgi:hypothetical protein